MLLNSLRDNEIIKEGNFTLKSGLSSKYYVDIKKTFSIPQINREINQLFFFKIKEIKNIKEFSVVGVPYSGIPYASNIAYHFSIPQLLLRNERKVYGTKNIIEGETNNKSIILIEDVISTGSSIMETLKILEENGYKVKYIFSVINRKDINKEIFLEEIKKNNINWINLLEL